MPSTYAHFRMGQQVFRELPKLLIEETAPYKELFDLGLHGPDILFYYNPVKNNRICRLGRNIHYKSGKEVFSDVWEKRLLHDNSPMYRAYVNGYICHFALDCMCHGYVNKYKNISGAGHFEIEMEFDRALMEGDGLDPLSFCPTAHLVPSMRNSAVISAFYNGVTPREIQTSIKTMRSRVRLLMTQNKAARAALTSGLKLTGQYKRLGGLIMSLEPNEKCMESNRRLSELYKLAVPLAKKLILEFDQSMSGKIPLDRHYSLNFESHNMDKD